MQRTYVQNTQKREEYSKTNETTISFLQPSSKKNPQKVQSLTMNPKASWSVDNEKKRARENVFSSMIRARSETRRFFFIQDPGAGRTEGTCIDRQDLFNETREKRKPVEKRENSRALAD